MTLLPYSEAKEMSVNYVNLDALIPREDFVIEEQPTQTSGTAEISIIHLEGPFFGPDLRKPDFQRETNNWTPTKVADLIQAFVDGDLIPAVILWKAGKFVFVIDGAHRLGALIAWVLDDYGDRQRSLDYFQGLIPEEQRKAAAKTRKAVNKLVGSYQEYLAGRKNPAGAPEELKKRIANLGVHHVIGQWVPRTDKASAEASFFKINQSATPIDPTEKRILKSRKSASAIAARAISNGGRGHKYWADFGKEEQKAIEEHGARIYHALYDPPMGPSVVTTLDVPVAGRGYNVLSFAFDLVNQSNKVDASDSSAKETDVKDTLPDDPDGKQTVAYLHEVEKTIRRITTDEPRSLGVHPVIYFYTRSGAFQPSAFLATSRFLEGLAKQDKLKDFTKVRSKFEEFLVLHKEALGLIVHKFGSGGRNVPWLVTYFNRILSGLWGRKSLDNIQKAFLRDKDFAFLGVQQGPRGSASPKKRQDFKGTTKTASFFAAALPGGTRCRLCGALLHKNSVHFDHIVPASKQGGADMKNAQPTHPYCDSIKQ
jgi:hypothetical protein